MRGVVLDSREKDGTSVVLLDDGRIEVVKKYYTIGEEINLKPQTVRHRPAIYLWQRAAVAAAIILLVFGLASPRITYASVTVDGVEYGVNMYNRVISMVAVDDTEETIAFVEENKDAYNKQSLDDVLDDVADKMLAENKDIMEIEVDGPAGMQEKMKERADEYKDRFEEKKKAEGNAGSQGGSAAPNTAGSTAGYGAPGAGGQTPEEANGQNTQTVNGQAAQGANNQNAQSGSGQNIQSGSNQSIQSGNGQNTQNAGGQSASDSLEDNAGAKEDMNNQNVQGSADGGGADENMSGRNDAGNAGGGNAYEGGHENGAGQGGNPGAGEPRR